MRTVDYVRLGCVVMPQSQGLVTRFVMAMDLERCYLDRPMSLRRCERDTYR
jgi:hypothetical protein